MFTPATKAPQGEHDQNISFAEMQQVVGEELAEVLRQRSLEVFAFGARLALDRGIIIADTKFEFGVLPASKPGAEPPDDAVLLIDEVLTPDSSRFWPAQGYEEGRSQPSYDKQFVRDWLSASGWDKNSPPPQLPPDVVERTRLKYIEVYERLTGERFAWA
jgi:phosphoribosylaminoimidazole-succinocarboxamide synthase